MRCKKDEEGDPGISLKRQHDDNRAKIRSSTYAAELSIARCAAALANFAINLCDGKSMRDAWTSTERASDERPSRPPPALERTLSPLTYVVGRYEPTYDTIIDTYLPLLLLLSCNATTNNLSYLLTCRLSMSSKVFIMIMAPLAHSVVPLICNWCSAYRIS
eukprot:scaffold6954_cov144-Skeletonema_menzelii.AAC.2